MLAYMNKNVTNLALLLVSITFGLGLGELSLRVFLPRTAMYSQFVTQGNTEDVQSNKVPDSAFYQLTMKGVRLKPNVTGIVSNHYLSRKDIQLRTNSLGFRGDEVELDSRKRILFLGDSITLADYLQESETFVSLVEQMSSGNLQTINAGLGSIGIDEELNILQEHGSKVRPDVVVLNLYLNDVLESPVLHLKSIPKWLRWSWLAQTLYRHFKVSRSSDKAISKEELNSWKDSLVARYPASETTENWKNKREDYNKLMLDWFTDWGSAYSDSARKRILNIADEIITHANALGAKTIVVVHPTRFQVEASFSANEPQIAFTDHFNKSNTPVLNLLPALRRKYNTGKEGLFFDHCHHNIEGSKFVAKEIYSFLENKS